MTATTTTHPGLLGLLLPLPDHALACEGCGVEVEHAAWVTPVEAVPSLPPDHLSARTWRGAASGFGRCPACQAIHDRAEAYLAEHEQWAASVGRFIATERVTSALIALATFGLYLVS